MPEARICPQSHLMESEDGNKEISKSQQRSAASKYD